MLYDPIADIIEGYKAQRFAGCGEEQSYMQALVVVQGRLLANLAADSADVRDFLAFINNRHTCGKLEIEYARAATALQWAAN